MDSQSDNKKEAKGKGKQTSRYDDQMLQYATRTVIETDLANTASGIPELRYKLEIAQHPIRARMGGFGDKDRRPISPLPAVRLKIYDEKGPFNIDLIDPGFFVLHANIITADEGKDASVVLNPRSTAQRKIYTDNLIGERSTNGKKLEDQNENIDIWFVYTNLSVRTQGTFKLQFTLAHVGWQGRINTSGLPIKVLGTVCSNEFTVYTPKTFPGMIEASELVHIFREQGNKIPIRRNNKQKKQEKPKKKKKQKKQKKQK